MKLSPIESFRTHSNYVRAFASLAGAQDQKSPDSIYPKLFDRIVQSSCFSTSHKACPDDAGQVFSSLSNAWGTELLINVAKHFIKEPELVKLSNNWTVVQAYYVLYHSTQAVAVAKGFVRPTSHPRTQKIFCTLWADRNLRLEPWTISYSPSGARNLPDGIEIDDAIHSWSHCSPVIAWSLACKALRTTREDKVTDSIGNAREAKRRVPKKESERRIQQDKNVRKTQATITRLPRLNVQEKNAISNNVPPATIIDYLYRLRIRTNYVDSSMFTDGPENDHISVQVRDDLSIISGGSLFLAELTIDKIIGHEIFLRKIKDWVRANVPECIAAGIRERLHIYSRI